MANAISGLSETRELGFEYVCFSGDKLNEFSIFANVVSETPDEVTITRFQRFGKLNIGDRTYNRKRFEQYYKKISDIVMNEKYAQIKEKLKKDELLCDEDVELAAREIARLKEKK